MRRSKTVTLKEAIDEYIKAFKLERKFAEVDIMRFWHDLLGPSVSAATLRVSIYNKKLFVYLNSSVVRHELFMAREDIRKALNNRAGQEIVDVIIFK